MKILRGFFLFIVLGVAIVVLLLFSIPAYHNCIHFIERQNWVGMALLGYFIIAVGFFYLLGIYGLMYVCLKISNALEQWFE